MTTTSPTGSTSTAEDEGPPARLWIEYFNTEGNDTTEIYYRSIYRDKLVDYGNGGE